MSMTTENSFKPGLAGVIAAETKLSRVDGQKGELIIAGYPLEEIAPQATFEEMVYLLWHGRPPTTAQLAQLTANMAALRDIPAAVYDLLSATAAQNKPAMTALRIAAGALDLDQPELDPQASAVLILARLPTIVAAYHRYQQGLEPIKPDASLSHVANYLYMLSGERPHAARTRGMETYFNTVVDHGLNASTFAGRVIIATQSDMVSAVTGAIGALKGPLHGGAPGPALDMVFEIGTADNAEPYLRAKLAQGDRLMGFGHRVYKVRDPRADVLGEAAATMFTAAGDMDLYHLALHVEKTAVRLLEETKPGRNLQTNVEFYTALLLHGFGLPTDLFTPTFALARTAGWIAHAFEQLATGRLIRPKAQYIGQQHSNWPPI